jgi:hypothetical protein
MNGTRTDGYRLMDVRGRALLRLHWRSLLNPLSFLPMPSLFLLLHMQVLEFARSLSITLWADAR